MALLSAATKAFLKKAITYISGAITIITGVKNFRTMQKLKDAGQDILATKQAQGDKIPIIYGRRRVGTTLLYMDTDSGNSKELFVIYGLCLGEVDAIELDTIEVNGVPLSDTKVFRDGYYTGSDKISSGSGSLCTVSQIGNSSGGFRGDGRSGTDPTKIYRMVFNAHHGADDQSADPMLVASQPTRFGTNHRLRGIAYIAASFQYDTKGMFTSIPEITVVVKGRKLYDPRLDGSITGGTGSHRIADPTTYTWSNNAALTLLDYMHQDYGKGLASSLIDLQSFQTAANTADAILDVPDYSGSYAAATFSADVEDNFITVNEATWKKIKGSELISVKDSSGSVIINQNNVIDSQRFTPHTQATNFRIYIDGVPPEKVSKGVTFAATNGDATITVTCTSHGASVNDRVLFSGATSLGGNITTTVLNKGYTIATVIDANTFTIEATNLNLETVLANSSDTGNGGGSAVGKFMYIDEDGSIFAQTRRLQCDGVLDTNETVLDNARDLLSNMRGFLNYVDGKYSVLVENTASSSFNITDDHIIDEGIKIRYEDKAQKLNKVVVQFFNAQKKFEADTKTVFHNNSNTTYKNDDGGEELETTAEFQYITNPYNAFNMGKGILERSRRQKTISFIGTPRLLNLTAGDVVTITYTPYNLSNAPYRIETINLLENGLVGIQAIEYFDFYTWSATPPEENVGGEPDLPTGTEAEPPTNLSFTDATSTRRAFLTWTAATNYPAKEFRVIIQNSSGQEIHNRIVSDAFIDLDFIAVANGYVASITSISSTGAESSASSITFDVTQQPVKLGDIQANAITANEINVTNLAAISADLGSVTAGSINIGSGAFTVSSSGVMTATGATVSGAITASSLNVTGATVTGTIDASKITLNGDPLTDIFALAGSGQAKTLSLGGDTKNLLKVDGIQLKYFAFDQVQNQGTEVLKMDMDTLSLFNTRFDHTQITFTSSGSIAANTLSATTSLTLGSGSAPSTTTNKLYNVGGSLFFNGSQLGTGTGDITAVVAGTNLNGGGTTGSVTLNLDSTITGNHTFSNNLIVGGDLSVQGTTTTLNTATLNVEDKNITLNYSTGDTSGSANGAGITIQDAVDASTDATILWDATNDEFDFSHKITAPTLAGTLSTASQPNITSVGTLTSLSSGSITAGNTFINSNGSIELERSGGAFIDFKESSVDFDSRIMGTSSLVFTTGGSGSTATALTLNSSQNATFAGAITTGDDIILPNDKDVIFRNSSGSDDGTKITRAGGNALRIKYTGNSAIFDALANNDFGIRNSNDAEVFRVKPNSTVASSSTDILGNLRMGTTTVIQSGSRNLTNIGTISSGAITTSGTFTKTFDVGNSITLGNDGTFGTSGTGRYVTLGFSGTGNGANRIFAHNTGQDHIYIAAATGKGVVIRGNGGGTNHFFFGSAGQLQVNGTTVLNQSRNLTNIQRINTADGINDAGSGGSESVFNNGGTTADFRVESNTRTHMLFVDGGLDRVGINTSSPTEQLNVAGSIHITGSGTFPSSGSGIELIPGSTNNFIQSFDRDNSAWKTLRIKSNQLELSTAGTERLRINSSGQVSIGTTSAEGGLLCLDTSGNNNRAIVIGRSATDDASKSSALSILHYNNGSEEPVCLVGAGIDDDTNNTVRIGGGFSNLNSATIIDFFTAANNDTTTGTRRMRIDSQGNLGLGTTSLDNKLHIEGTDTSTSDTFGLKITNTSFTTNTTAGILFENADNHNAYIRSVRSGSSLGILTFGTNTGGGIAESNISERMRIDGSGNLFVGKTSSGLNTAGVEFASSGRSRFTRDANNVAEFNRKTSDGSIVSFNKDATAIGNIGSEGGDSLFIQGGTSSGSGLLMHGTGAKVLPLQNGASVDATIDLGQSSRRFKDLHLSGTISSGNITMAQSGEATATFQTSNASGADATVIIKGARTAALDDISELKFDNVASTYTMAKITGGQEQTHTNKTGSLRFYTSTNSSTGLTAKAELTSAGVFTCTNDIAAFSSLSDIRLKENIELINNPLDKIKSLRGVNFSYKKDGRESTGLIAQELEKVLPNAVYTTQQIDDDEDIKAIRYGNVVGLLVEAIKEQQEQIEELKAKLREVA